jgi:predicted kinase
MKTATITFGLPGSGKSTWISENTCRDDILISADEIKKQFPGYSDEKHADFYQLAVDSAEMMVYNSANQDEDIIFDSGSINSNYSARILKRLKHLGYQISFIVFNTPVDVCIERDRNRPQSVGEEVIRAKEEKRAESLGRLVSLLDSQDLIFIVKD